MSKRNFLLGKGERLTNDVIIKSGFGEKSHPYTFKEAQTRLSKMLNNVVQEIGQLPIEATPEEQIIASLTLNPEYIAKSYYPTELLRSVGLEAVGSRPKKLIPEKRSKLREPEEALTTELFVRGTRTAFSNWNAHLPHWTEAAIPNIAKELQSIELVSLPKPLDKIKGALPQSKSTVFEVVLHADKSTAEKYSIPQFAEYLKLKGINSAFGYRFYAGGLCFLELEAPTSKAEEIATFTSVRALREMPVLRLLRPTIRSAAMPAQSISFPAEGPVDANIKVAIFDGGIPDNHPMQSWVTPIDASGIGKPSDELHEHGVGVTSAFLFGHIDPKKPLPRPFAAVDHYRVLDTEPGEDPHQLPKILSRIEEIIKSKHYDFINLSLGPRLPIDDDDVHAWTAVLDEQFSNGKTMATIAVGNDGEGDAQLGLNRVQVPSDCVNALAIGACDTPDKVWQRASYSSVGPGRSPGLIKPDFVDFGGSLQRPYIVVGATPSYALRPTGGTSFAAPNTLRMGAGIMAHFGKNLSPLAIRTLLVHSVEGCNHDRSEVGWGRAARNLEDIVLCDDNTIRVVYQGEISATKSIRAAIPMPSGELIGKINIKATLCYVTEVDVHHPGNYTRAGLNLVFRPNEKARKNAKQVHADTKDFFAKSKKVSDETDLRRDAWKWENCIHGDLNLYGSSINNPVFDIHYTSRSEGRGAKPPEKLHYAMVITVQAKKMPDFYDSVVRKYATQLEAFQPIIDIPVRI